MTSRLEIAYLQSQLGCVSDRHNVIDLARDLALAMSFDLTNWLRRKLQCAELLPIRAIAALSGAPTLLLALLSMCSAAATDGEFTAAGTGARAQDSGCSAMTQALHRDM